MKAADLFRRHHLSGMVLRDELLRRGWIHQIRQRSDGPAQVFLSPGLRRRDRPSSMPYEKTSAPPAIGCASRPLAKLHLCLFAQAASTCAT